MKTYHDQLEAAYFGKARNLHGVGVSVQVPPLKSNPRLMDNLVSVPSYHFGQMLNAFVKANWPEPDMSRVSEYMSKIGKSRLAVVYDTGRLEDAVIVTFDLTKSQVPFISIAAYDTTGVAGGVPNSWLAFTGQTINGSEGWPFIGIALHGLELLANPTIAYEMAKPPAGVAKMAAGRDRRNEVPVAPMKIVRLTKRVRINGQVLRPGATGCGSEKSPHTRDGHWRHSKRQHPGWEGPVTPESGEWAGVSCYRRWIDDAKVKGGVSEARSHLFDAPQYRVVR